MLQFLTDELRQVSAELSNLHFTGVLVSFNSGIME